MFNIDSATAVATQPTQSSPGTPGWFAKPDPVAGIAPTQLTWDWANGIQAELINLITDPTGGNLVLAKTDQQQVLKSIKKMIVQVTGNPVRSVNSITADGNGNVNVGTVKTVSAIGPDGNGNVDLSSVYQAKGNYVNKAGDTMTGGLTVPSFRSNGSATFDVGILSNGVTSSNRLDVAGPAQFGTNIYVPGFIYGETQSDGAQVGYSAATLRSEFFINGSQYGFGSGVYKFPNGLILQTFGGALPSGGSGYFTYPITFPNSAILVVGTIGASGDPQAALQVAPVSYPNPGYNSSCLARLTGSGGGSNGLNFFAMGW